jgi:hypothetical protein
MNTAIVHAGHPLEESDRSLDNPGPGYPAPASQLELSAYKVHVIAKYFDDVKTNTSQLARAVVFLWTVFIIPPILLYVAATYIDWTILPAGWKWMTGVGCLGTIMISMLGRRKTRGGTGLDQESMLDAVERGLEECGQIADQIAAAVNADGD